MWQRALYPRIVILQPRENTRRGTVARLRTRYDIRYAISVGAPPPEAGFEEIRDLGPALGATDRVLVRASPPMMFPAAGIALTVLLAAGFAAAGEAILRRRSIGVSAWNEAFLVGAGCSAGILFPLSLLLPTRALDGLLILLGLAIIGGVASRIRRPPGHAASPRVPRGFSGGTSAPRGDRPRPSPRSHDLSFRYTLGGMGSRSMRPKRSASSTKAG